MEKSRKLELIQRSLGIRHKLKVHESMKLPDSHEEIAVMMLAKWELEDELHAIEQILAEVRHGNVGDKRQLIQKQNAPLIKKTKKKT
jgi:HD-like signal output (HDOD) protein